MDKTRRLKKIAPGYYMVCRSDSEKKDLEQTRQRIIAEGSSPLIRSTTKASKAESE